VNGQGAQATFNDSTLIKAIPSIMDVLRAQTFAHCPGFSSNCTWAREGLSASFDTTLAGPTFAALADLLEAIRSDATARPEVEQLVGYLLDAVSGNQASTDTLSAMVDVLQTLEDDTNMQPLEQLLAIASSSPVLDDKGNVVRRGLVDAGVRALSRVFEEQPNAAQACWVTRDPNRVLGELLTNLVTPESATVPAPFEVISDVVAAVNRADPSAQTKLAAPDYGNIADEVSQFVLDPATGLEQVYAIVRQTTDP
jgi:hypothetical protein